MPHETVTLRTCDLIGAALDWAVAVSVGESSPRSGLGGGGCVVAHGHTLHRYCPSTEWSHGGPLIHEYRIGFSGYDEENWLAYTRLPVTPGNGIGPTHLIAACRAIVSAHLGDSVDVPAELVGGGV